MDIDLFDAVAAAICVLDGEDRIEYASTGFREMLGVSADLERVPFLHLVHDDARDATRTLLERARDGEAGQADLPLRATDGARRWVIASASPLPGASNGGRRVACVMVDITERRGREDRLRESEAQYRVLAETAEDHIFVIGRDDRVEYVNSAGAQQFRARPEQLIGRRRAEIFPPDVAERQGQNLDRVFSTGQPVYAEGRTMYLDREVWLGTWLVPVPDGAGGIKAVLGLSRDMTAQRRSQAEVSHAQKLEAIGRLAGGIAHDFNNNLAAILGYVEVMLEDVGAESPLGRHLKEVQHAGQRAAGLVRRLLAFGRRQVLHPRDLNLNALIDGLTPMLGRLIGTRIGIEAVRAADLWLVTADPGEVEQVIMNLALNARDAMPAGGTLTIETANVAPSEARDPSMMSGPFVRMTIRDTGAGMDAHVKAHVFEPFFTTKPVGEGTGLGLSTVYGIVKQLNGFIWVDSEVGRGTAFEVYVPAAAAGVTAEVDAPSGAPRPVAARRETVLVVEDEHAVRRFARLALERQGFRVIEAASPEEALSIASGGSERPRLLLTDVVMPRMNGPELAARLTQILPDLIVLYMSGYTSSVLQDATRDPSMRVLAKPFTVAELVMAIDNVLGASGGRP